MFITLFLSLVVSAAPKGSDWTKNPAQVAEVAKSAKCEATISAMGSCMREMMDEEADGFLIGRTNTISEDLVKDMSTKPWEFLLLKGIDFQPRPSA